MKLIGQLLILRYNSCSCVGRLPSDFLLKNVDHWCNTMLIFMTFLMTSDCSSKWVFVTVSLIKCCYIFIKYFTDVFCLSLISAMKKFSIFFILLSLNRALAIWLIVLCQTHVVHSFSIFYFKKCFKIILSFFLKSSSENQFVKSDKRLPLNIRSTNLIKNYTHIFE